jgi:thioredoxin-like negative regulator of GroEL
MLREVNKDNFDQEVVASQQPVLVDFWGPRCGPCLALMPYVEEGTDGKEADRLTGEISREKLKSFVTDFVQSQEENA